MIEKPSVFRVLIALALGVALVAGWPSFFSDHAVAAKRHGELVGQTYEGGATCEKCHHGLISEVSQSVHYRWQGPTPDVPNLGFAGKMGSINDFCTYPDFNFLFSMVVYPPGGGQTGPFVLGCGTCHVGFGDPPPTDISTSPGNGPKNPNSPAFEGIPPDIDCLFCHSDVYTRHTAMVNGKPRIVPTEPEISQAVADSIGTPSSASCLKCHANAGGGNGVKQGDLVLAMGNLNNPQVDVHMASEGSGGVGFACLDCHTVKNHLFAGRGNDLRPTELSAKVDCTRCHGAKPHDKGKGDFDEAGRLNAHTDRVHCNVCHIPSFARTVDSLVPPTDMRRDFSTIIFESNITPPRWEPHRVFDHDVKPEYRFFNGQSYFYEFGAPTDTAANDSFLLAGPLGDINDPGAKIHAFKLHQAVMGVDKDTTRLIPVKSQELWSTGNIDAALKQGASEVGWGDNINYYFINTERYLALYHQVPPHDQALSCSNCHEGGGQMDFAALGYTLKEPPGELCITCHGPEEPENFYALHAEHVDEAKIDCSACHTFGEKKGHPKDPIQQATAP